MVGSSLRSIVGGDAVGRMGIRCGARCLSTIDRSRASLKLQRMGYVHCASTAIGRNVCFVFVKDSDAGNVLSERRGSRQLKVVFPQNKFMKPRVSLGTRRIEKRSCTATTPQLSPASATQCWEHHSAYVRSMAQSPF